MLNIFSRNTEAAFSETSASPAIPVHGEEKKYLNDSIKLHLERTGDCYQTHQSHVKVLHNLHFTHFFLCPKQSCPGINYQMSWLPGWIQMIPARLARLAS